MSTFKCNHCLFESNNNKIMKYHLFIEHGIASDITYNCTFCIFRTKNKDMFSYHLLHAHSYIKAKL